MMTLHLGGNSRKVLAISSIVFLLFIIVSWLSVRKNPTPSFPSSLTTYQDQENFFEVAYDPALLNFKENFSITAEQKPWICKSTSQFSEEYLSPELVSGGQCRRPSSLAEFVNYTAPQGAQTAFTTTAGNSVILLHLQTVVTSLHGKPGTSDTYRIFVEAPAARKSNLFALDFYLVPQKGTVICGDKICDIGEESSSRLSFCTTDCPNGKDWMDILKRTFATLRFL